MSRVWWDFEEEVIFYTITLRQRRHLLLTFGSMRLLSTFDMAHPSAMNLKQHRIIAHWHVLLRRTVRWSIVDAYSKSRESTFEPPASALPSSTNSLEAKVGFSYSCPMPARPMSSRNLPYCHMDGRLGVVFIMRLVLIICCVHQSTMSLMINIGSRFLLNFE